MRVTRKLKLHVASQSGFVQHYPMTVQLCPREYFLGHPILDLGYEDNLTPYAFATRIAQYIVMCVSHPTTVNITPLGFVPVE